MSGRSIDHVVVAVRDLDAASATYEKLGFQLTPRASHPDIMGTSNRLALFKTDNFIELLEVDRPNLLAPHDLTGAAPFFGFGDHNRQAVGDREGMSMLAFAGGDADGDVSSFAARGIPAFGPFEFKRQARLADGREVTLEFRLVFARSPDMPRVAFFTCEDRVPDYFRDPGFHHHDNCCIGISKVFLASDDPRREAEFVGSLFDGQVSALGQGFSVSCGGSQQVVVDTFEAMAGLDPTFRPAPGSGAILAGIELMTDMPESASRATIASADAHGIFISWAASG